MYNACANRMFNYSVRRSLKLDDDAARIKLVGAPANEAIPPVLPDMVDVIIAGFPWSVSGYACHIRNQSDRPGETSQSHSMLNQYRQADDRKTNLMLNLLSWVDFLQPKFCFFENVRGFMSYKLDATQASSRAVEGGIEMGGLKLLIRVLVALK